MPQSALNSRNWRNKSIDTPDVGGSDGHYAYPIGKRAGSTVAGERQHQTMVVASSNPVSSTKNHINPNATTDYSYNIGPTQYK